jgi:Flp pilus assembly protein TadG
MATLPRRASRERGQVLAIFALSLVALIAMVGLVLDGGSTFVQRRDQQNVADAAAMAGAYAWLWTGSSASGAAAALDAAADNGYTHGTDGVVVDVQTANVFGTSRVTVTVTKPHVNHFAGVVGLSSWNVSAAATAQAGAPNAAIGAMPLLFNEDAFPNGRGPTNEVSFSEPPVGGDDVPQEPGQFNWTVYCTAEGEGHEGCNADSNTVEELIEFENERDQEVTLDMDIGPLNAGSHTSLFSAMAGHIGEEFPVSIVDDDGNMVGWAMFHLTGSVGGSTKQISGYFVDPVNYGGIYIAAGGGTGSSLFGAHEVKLIN